MKNHMLFLGVAMMAASLPGCSKPSSTATGPKFTDWGVVAVADGVSSRHVLSDGRVCTLTPKVLPGGHQVQLEASITNVQADGARQVYSITSFFDPDLATIFAFDPSNTVALTLHISP